MSLIWTHIIARVVVALSLMGLVGSIIAVVFAVRLPKPILDLYIGILFVVTSLVALVTRNSNYGFSWIRLLCFGSLAAFNKGFSGGGYGPLVTSGQILAGVKAKNAIGIACLAEGVTFFVAVLMYLLFGREIDWFLSILLLGCVMFSAALPAFVVRKNESKRLRLFIETTIFLLGLSTILGTL